MIINGRIEEKIVPSSRNSRLFEPKKFIIFQTDNFYFEMLLDKFNKLSEKRKRLIYDRVFSKS